MLRSARPLGDIEGTILLAVPNDFTKQWIEDKAQSKLTTALSVHLGRTVRIAITVDPSIEVVTQEEEKEEAKKLFGLVFQNFNLFPHWTVVKNVMDPLIHVQKKTKEEAEEA